MDIILLKDLDKVGEQYDVVKVKNGYGRNYLIPQGIGLIANDTNMRRLADLRKREAAKEAKMKDVYQKIADQLVGKVLKIGAKAGTSGKIFGSVTSIQIAAALKEQFDVEVKRKKIELPVEVKNLGEYKVNLKLHPEVNPVLDIEVVAD